MEIIRHDFSPAEADISRQIGIGAVEPVYGLPDGICLPMDDLAGRMNACVSASGTVQINRMVGHPAESLLDLFLDAANSGLLSLPTAVCSAAVFDTGGNPGNNSGRPRGGRVTG